MQLDRLKQALGQNTREGLLNNNSSKSCDKFNFSDNFDDNSDDAIRGSSSNCESDATYDSSSVDKSNLDFEGLPDNYLCGGFPDKMLIEALKELNISDIKDFLNNDTSKSFKE